MRLRRDLVGAVLATFFATTAVPGPGVVAHTHADGDHEHAHAFLGFELHREAVFADTSVSKFQLRTNDPVIHFTPGDPFGVRAGVKVFF